jgi:transposase
VTKLFVGVDWAHERHRVVVVDEAGAVVNDDWFEHRPEGLQRLAQWLRSLADPSEVVVGIELKRGAIVDVLMEHGFKVFGLNPLKTDRFRDRVHVSGTKDDDKDAFAIALALRHDLHAFRELEADHPLVLEIREWSRIHAEVIEERVRLVHQLRAHLHRYAPHYLELDFDALWVLTLLEHAPTPSAARALPVGTVTKVLKEGRVRKWSPDQLLDLLRRPGLRLAPGAEKAAAAHVRVLLPRLRVVVEQEHQAERRLKALCDELESEEAESGEQSDVAILRSVPGLGRIVLAALLAEASGLLRRRDYEALRCTTGVAPIMKQTGKNRRGVVVMRRARSARLSFALYHWAGGATQHHPRWRERYTALRARGHSHARALRSLGDRLLKLTCVLLERGELYREKTTTVTA